MRIDVVSVVLSAFGFGGLVYGLSSFGAGDRRARRRRRGSAFAVGVVGLAAFVGRQLVLQRDDRALLDLRTFRFRIFTAASVLMMLMMAVLLGAIVLLPIYMQTVQRLAPLTTGLLLLPGGLLMGLLGPVVGRLYDRFGARALLVPGHRRSPASRCGRRRCSACTARRRRSSVFHLLLSVGLAFVFTPLFTAGLGALPARLYSYGSAVFGATQQLAGAAGVALLVSVFSVRSAALAVRRGRGRGRRGRGARRVRRGGVPVGGGDRRGAVRPHAAAGDAVGAPSGTDIGLLRQFFV